MNMAIPFYSFLFVAKTAGSFQEFYNGNQNVAKHNIQKAEQGLCACVINLGTILCRLL